MFTCFILFKTEYKEHLYAIILTIATIISMVLIVRSHIASIDIKEKTLSSYTKTIIKYRPNHLTAFDIFGIFIRNSKVANPETATFIILGPDLVSNGIYLIQNKKIKNPLYSPEQAKDYINLLIRTFNLSRVDIIDKMSDETDQVESRVSELIEEAGNNIKYLNEVIYTIESSEEIDNLIEIKEELEPENTVKEKHKKAILPEEIELEGFKVYIGKNNRQNDYIVSKLAKDEDYWFHTKDCAGSHVLLKCLSPTDKLLLECAKLAKKYSSASDSSKVGVIYTKRKNLRKPPAANLGYVTYKSEKEIIID